MGEKKGLFSLAHEWERIGNKNQAALLKLSVS